MKTRLFILSLSMLIASASLTSCGSSMKEEFASDYADSIDAVPEEAAFEDGDYADTAEEAESADDEKLSDETAEIEINDEGDAFILTAGEWNDNANWGFFKNLIKNSLVTFPSYGLNPVHRIAVTVKNEGVPAADSKVELLDGDNVVWSSVTDKNGVAYLFWEGGAEVDFRIAAEGVAEPYNLTLSDIADSSQSDNNDEAEITLESDGIKEKHAKTEVMFILDTTGSMGDEISYLQKDFASIAAETAREGISFSVNFYRDKGDDYVTKCNPFTDDVKSIQKLLNNEYAEGGGDAPEAVAEILEDTIINGEWSEDSNKIAFLIFDAPPHDDTEKTITEAVKAASAKGIHIVPVVASNADRSTELFGRAVAIMTNSSYVFLTDDSGVGGSHLEPIIGSYDVELLHDIIVRNINELAD